MHSGLLNGFIYRGVEQFLRDGTGHENVIARRDDEAIPTIASPETASLSFAVTQPFYLQGTVCCITT